MNNEERKESQIETVNDVTTDEIPVAICIETESISCEIVHETPVNAINIESYSYYNYNHPPELSNSENHTIINIDTLCVNGASSAHGVHAPFSVEIPLRGISTENPFPPASSRSDNLPIYISQESTNNNYPRFVKIRHIIGAIVAFAAILTFIFSFHP